MTPTLSPSQEDFVQALLAFVTSELRITGEIPDYCQQAIRIVDARNHIFCSAGSHVTDEEHGIYALRDLCALDDEQMELRPDRWRCAAIARDFHL